MSPLGPAWPVWGAVSVAMLVVLLAVFLRRIRMEPDGRRLLVAAGVVSAAVVVGVAILVVLQAPAP